MIPLFHAYMCCMRTGKIELQGHIMISPFFVCVENSQMSSAEGSVREMKNLSKLELEMPKPVRNTETLDLCITQCSHIESF